MVYPSPKSSALASCVTPPPASMQSSLPQGEDYCDYLVKRASHKPAQKSRNPPPGRPRLRVSPDRQNTIANPKPSSLLLTMLRADSRAEMDQTRLRPMSGASASRRRRTRAGGTRRRRAALWKKQGKPVNGILAGRTPNGRGHGRTGDRCQ